jgi:acetyl esterase/lipase
MNEQQRTSDKTNEHVDFARRALLMLPIITGLPTTLAGQAMAATSSNLAARALPPRTLPVPDTVGPALQAVIATPYPVGWDVIPQTAAQWNELASLSATAAAPFIAEIYRRFDIRVEKSRIGDVNVFTITPAEIPAANRNCILLHLHGGGNVLYPGESGAGEGMLMAGFGRYKVISIDYRMGPDFPFPASLDDATAVWRALLNDHDPRRMGVFGSSSGGGLTLALMLRAKAEALPLPAAIAPGTPWVDLTGAGDSIMANAFVDNVLVASTGWAGAAAKLYAGTHDLRDPLISPIFGDFSGLPPAILTSGTRDLFLSHTVRTHRKLRHAGIDARLQVFEGQSHAQFLDPFVPETEEAFSEIARFFTLHLKT